MLYYQEQLDNPIIVALDSAGKEGALEIMEELKRKVWGFKLGALLLQHGTSLINEIRERIGSLNLFIDLQFTGVPDFIREAICTYSLYSTDIGYVVVNASAGPPGIKAAVETAKISRILVGSALDSLRPADTNLIYGTYFQNEVTLRFAIMGKAEGARGIYCSSEDLEFLSRYPELKDFDKIAYGVRPEWDSDHGTHGYVLTPREALKRGATKFVIGGTIRNAKDRVKAVERILKEIKRR